MIELTEVGYKLLIILTIYAALLIFYILYLYLKEPFNCDELGPLLMMGIVFFMMPSAFLIKEIRVRRQDMRAHDTTIKTEDLSVEELRIRKEFLENKTERGKLLEDIKRLEEERHDC